MMKLALIVLVGVVACQAITDDEVMQQWGKFQKQFGKSYKSPLEQRKRLTIFKENLEAYEKHNELYAKGEVTYTKGVNQFADWTTEEFIAYVNKFQMIPDEQPVERFNASENFHGPESVDWRTKGAVTEVKNQGQCGSCWTFSSTGAIEGLLKVKYDRLISLSEQNLVDCATDGAYGCGGGFMTVAFRYVQENGIETEQEYPYEAKQKQCRQKRIVARITGYQEIQGEEALEEALATVGPIAIALEATGELQGYSGGVLTDRSCTQRLNHAVLAVGYGEENGQKYWIVKNSWGAQWGEEGYFRIVRGQNNCGLSNMASYPTLD